MVDKNVFDELEEKAFVLDNSRRDLIIPAKDVKVIDSKNIKIGSDTSKMNEWALNSVCDLSGVPMAYMKKCVIGGKEDLVSSNINKWLADDSRSFLIRRYDDTIEGILSEKYISYSHLEAVQSIKEGFANSEIEIKTSSINSYCMHLRMVFPAMKKDFMQSDPFTPGFDIVNSETGKFPFMVDPKLYRMICTNGMVVEEKSLKFIRYRHVHLSTVNLMMLNDYILGTLNVVPEVMSLAEQTYSGSTKIALNKNEVDKIYSVMKLKYPTKKIVNPIFEDLAKRDSVSFNLEGNTDILLKGSPTLSGFWNSATQMSQSLNIDIEEQTAIEITASQILFRIFNSRKIK